ncbi:outer membrane beta-barrel protein [Corallincola holothuriorum]|nr:outer membrane beta-barrel protein [Corallincola holothuriorum]
MLNFKIKTTLTTAVVFCSFSSAVCSAEFDPAPYKMESGLTLTPVLETSVGYDDNVANSNVDEIDSMYTEIAPHAVLAGGSDISNASLKYGFDKAWYFDSSDDDYFDHTVLAKLHHEFTAKYRVDVTGGYQRAHDARGTGISEGNEGLFDDVTEYDYYRAGATLGMGAYSSDLRFDLRSRYEKKEYSNFRDVTKYRDYDSIEVGATTYWSVMPKTDLTFDVSYEDIEYDTLDLSAISRDSEVLTALMGLKWDITGKTDGRARIGWQNKDFEDGDRENFDDVSWDVELSWQPKAHTVFTFVTGRDSKDPDTFGDYIKQTNVEGIWQHKWLERLSSELSVRYVDESYTGVDRDDEYWEAAIGAVYDFRRWLRFKAEYVWSDKDSNVDEVTYNKNLFLVSVQASL